MTRRKWLKGFSMIMTTNTKRTTSHLSWRIREAGKTSFAFRCLIALQTHVLSVRMDGAIMDYILAIAEATRRNDELAIGLSPRGSLALMQASRAAALLAGRDYVVPDDVRDLAPSVCAHRLLTKALTHDGSAASEAIFGQILETVLVPR